MHDWDIEECLILKKSVNLFVFFFVFYSLVFSSSNERCRISPLRNFHGSRHFGFCDVILVIDHNGTEINQKSDSHGNLSPFLQWACPKYAINTPFLRHPG